MCEDGFPSSCEVFLSSSPRKWSIFSLVADVRLALRSCGLSWNSRVAVPEFCLLRSSSVFFTLGWTQQSLNQSKHPGTIYIPAGSRVQLWKNNDAWSVCLDKDYRSGVKCTFLEPRELKSGTPAALSPSRDSSLRIANTLPPSPTLSLPFSPSFPLSLPSSELHSSVSWDGVVTFETVARCSSHARELNRLRWWRKSK